MASSYAHAREHERPRQDVVGVERVHLVAFLPAPRAR
jgi:hypothetical protein